MDVAGKKTPPDLSLVSSLPLQKSDMIAAQPQSQSSQLQVPQTLHTEVVPRFDSSFRMTDLIKDESEHIAEGLRQIKSRWTHVSSVDEVCKMALTMMKILEGRRNLLMNYEKSISRAAARFDVYDE